MEWSERLAGYKLEPPVPMARVERFEKRNRIVLPAEYRDFITTVCSGIDVESDQPGLLSPPDLDQDDERLSRPFPLVEYRPFDDDEAYERARCGQLYVGTDGCTCDWYLIVTGPERGGMWEIEDEGAQPCAPKLTFLPWLELRIDCDSGRNPVEWWDAVWRDVDHEALERAAAERDALNRSRLETAIRTELDRRFPEAAFRLAEDEGTIAVFKAAHPEVGDVAICRTGAGATVLIGNITGEYFRLDEDAGVEGAGRVAHQVAQFLADLFAGEILLWQSTGVMSGGYHLKKRAFREEDMERWGGYYLWSGPIEMRKRPRWWRW